MCVLINTTCLPVSRLSPSTSLPRCHHVTGSTLCSADVGEQLLSSVSTCNITCSSLLAADPGEQLLSSVSTCNITCSSLLAADPGEQLLSSVSTCNITCSSLLAADPGEQLLSSVSACNITCSSLLAADPGEQLLSSVSTCNITCSSLLAADPGEQLLSSVSTCNITCSSLLSADPGEQLLSSVSLYYLFLSAFNWPRWTIAFQCFNTSPVPLCFQLTQVNDCFPVFQHITCSSLSWCRWTIAFQCFNTSPVPLSADAGEQLLSSVSTHYLFSSAFSWPRWTIAWLSTHRTSRSIHQAQRCCTRSSDTGTSCRTTRMSSRRRGPTSLHSENAKTCWVPCGEKSSRSPDSWVGVSAAQELEKAADLVTSMIWVNFGRLTFNSIALRSELVRWPLKPHHFGAFWQKSQNITPNSTYFKQTVLERLKCEHSEQYLRKEGERLFWIYDQSVKIQLWHP